MKEVTDYYAELKISQSAGLAEIKQKLADLRNTWVSRQTTYPEKANKMIVLLDEADKVFASEASRKKYDKELEKSKADPETRDPDAERAASFEHWREEAKKYFDNEQYDLAKTAIEKAFRYQDASSDDAEFYSFASDLYLRSDSYDRALEYSNQAILSDSENAFYYLQKYDAQCRMESGYERYGFKSAEILNQEEKSTLDIALKKAGRSSNQLLITFIFDALAEVWYYDPNHDVKKAVEYAHKALASGQPQDCPRSQKVLDSIKENNKNSELRQLDQKGNQELQQLGPKPERHKWGCGMTGSLVLGIILLVYGLASLGSSSGPAILFFGAIFAAPGIISLVSSSVAANKWEAQDQAIRSRHEAALKEIQSRYDGSGAKKFCKKCGKQLDQNGTCPACGTYYPQ